LFRSAPGASESAAGPGTDGGLAAGDRSPMGRNLKCRPAPGRGSMAPVMHSRWRPLLDALIGELEYRRSLGVRFVAISADGLAVLKGLGRMTVSDAGGGRQDVSVPKRPAGIAAPETAQAERPPLAAPRDRPSGAPAAPADRIHHAPASDAVRGAGAPKNGSPGSPPVTGAAVLPGLFAGDSRPVLGRQARLDAFEELRRRVLQCTRCPHLVASRKNVVFGVGTTEAELVFVGEAPGAEEDEQGEPFVGPAGQLLTKIIHAMGFTRDQVYIANILKCRPDTPGQTSGNRKPTPTEMATCFPYLREQLLLIRPQVIVALGATAVEGLLGKPPVGITRLRGQWQEWEGIPVMPTYHPAYLLRNQSLAEKRKVWEDMLKVLERLGRPITDRQRNYFTRPGNDRG